MLYVLVKPQRNADKRRQHEPARIEKHPREIESNLLSEIRANIFQCAVRMEIDDAVAQLGHFARILCREELFNDALIDTLAD